MPIKTKKDISKKKPLPASAGIKQRLKKKIIREEFQPDDTDETVTEYLDRRIEDLIDWRKGLGIEQRWHEADEEYIPHELDFGTTRKRFETDQDTGLRSRMVPVGDITQQWRSAASSPTLLSKIQTAISIIIDQQPEGELTPLLKKYEKTTDLAYSLWKRNWSISNAKEKLKVFIFDLAKYGWAVQKTYPHVVKYPKRVLVETDPNNPENDKYEDRELIWYNDVDRAHLDVYTTWIDELAAPYDPYSVDEVYYEMDFSYDAGTIEFGKYPNWGKYVRPDSQMVRNTEKRKTNRSEPQTKNRRRKDIVTVGFFESRKKDLYTIWVPKDKIILHKGPLPNDDGYLSITQTMWMMRKSNLPYGVSLWEIIRQNKQLYDKMKNMTMDQLVLSIMKFGFHTGTQQNVGDGKIEVVPGQSRQVTTASGNARDAFNWMEIPGPGDEAWKGLEVLADMMDDDSGISPTLEGDITGKTLGEILHAKDAALKRLKVPVENICWQIEQDAYLTLSWMSQIYSIPTIKDFASEKEMMDYEKEEQITHVGGLFGEIQKDENGQPMVDPVSGKPVIGAPFKVQYYPQLSLHLENSEGNLIKSKESNYLQVGKDILPGQLKWRGIFKVLPRSLIDKSQDLTKAMHMEVFNMIIPLLQFPPELVARPVSEILKDNELDPKDWLPDAWNQYLENGVDPQAEMMKAMAAGGPQTNVQGAAAGIVAPAEGAPQPGAPMASGVNPGSQMPPISQLMGGLGKGLFNKRMQ